ncbi:MAG: hypothetical protein EBR81_16705, partial [Proteobacteria bacterium]|nr:hypothetical protein [Pseudomonadota bacterium]
GGVNVASGGLVLGASSTGTGLVTSGPVGTGVLTLAAGATLLNDQTSRTILNPVVFQGTPLFDATTGTASVTLTLNGGLTLPSGDLVLNVTNPYLTVAMNGAISNFSSLTSVTTTGLGRASLAFAGSSNIPFNIVTGPVTLLNTGSGTGTAEVLNYGAISVGSYAPTMTLGAGYNTNGIITAANKLLAPTAFTSLIDGTPAFANGLSVTNSNGFGLLLPDSATLGAPVGGVTFNVATASASNVVQGLTLSGVLSGGTTDAGSVTFKKTGLGTLVLAGTANTFGAVNTILDVTAGMLQFGNDGALGNVGTLRISTNSATQGLRVAGGSVTTARTILLGTLAGAIDVTAGNVFTLTSALVFSGTNTLTKNDNGILALTVDAPTLSGTITVNAGALLLSSSLAAGNATINEYTS